METLEILTYLVWLVASVTFILALKFLASPKSARTGNLLGAAGMALIVAWTFFVRDGESACSTTGGSSSVAAPSEPSPAGSAPSASR